MNYNDNDTFKRDLIRVLLGLLVFISGLVVFALVVWLMDMDVETALLSCPIVVILVKCMLGFFLSNNKNN